MSIPFPELKGKPTLAEIREQIARLLATMLRQQPGKALYSVLEKLQSAPANWLESLHSAEVLAHLAETDFTYAEARDANLCIAHLYAVRNGQAAQAKALHYIKKAIYCHEQIVNRQSQMRSREQARQDIRALEKLNHELEQGIGFMEAEAHATIQLIDEQRKLQRDIYHTLNSLCELLPSLARQTDTARELVQDALNRTGSYVNVRKYLGRMDIQFPLRLHTMCKDLTEAQIIICTLIRNGLQNRQIAELSGISLRTVETHRRRIRKKLAIPIGLGLASYLKQL